MKKFLSITIDVEPDCTTSWRYSDPLTFHGVSKGIKERLHPLFVRYNMYPTYLINNVVLEDEGSCSILQSLPGKYELGTHLHPEFIEPQKAFSDYAGKKGEANCCFYPPEIEFGKLKNITDLFKERFGYDPLSFRAGRFSAGPNTIKSLATLGYKLDTSVTPHVRWEDKTREQPVDYRSAYEQPYFMKEGTVLEKDNAGKILQVPVSIAQRKANLLSELKRTRFGIRQPVRKYRPLWLRPVYSRTSELISIAEEYIGKYNSSNVFLNMMFHNVEVLPMMSPYTRTEADCEAYLKQLEDFFKYCSSNDIQGATLSDVNQYLKS